MTPLQVHTDTWKECTNCRYHERRTRVVLGKGRSPCDVLFVGEGPGDSEDTSGVPFDGQAGDLLSKIVKMAGADKYRCAYNNLVACISLCFDETTNRWVKEDPDHECVMACQPRLIDFIRITKPKLVVSVGKQSDEYFDPSWRDAVKPQSEKVPFFFRHTSFMHPAAILRAPFVGRSLMVQRCVAVLRRAILDTFS